MKYIMLLLLPALVFAKQPERNYQDTYCAGIVEHRLPDKTRVDCLTDTHAIEYDFSRKWAEAIGQSLGYSMETGKKAGIVLIMNKTSSAKHLRKMNKVIQHYGLDIDVWTVDQ